MNVEYISEEQLEQAPVGARAYSVGSEFPAFVKVTDEAWQGNTAHFLSTAFVAGQSIVKLEPTQ